VPRPAIWAASSLPSARRRPAPSHHADAAGMSRWELRFRRYMPADPPPGWADDEMNAWTTSYPGF